MTNTETLLQEIEDGIKFETAVCSICALTALSESAVKNHVAGLTEFEINVIKRALALGEFDITRLNFNLEFIAIHFHKNGRKIYDRQMVTAENVYNLLKAEMKVKTEQGTF